MVDLNAAELMHCSVTVSVDTCEGICNIIGNTYVKVSTLDDTKLVNTKMFKIITQINELKSLVKLILINCRLR